MRRLRKLLEPAVLAANGVQWLAEYLADKANPTKKFRYRHAEIKTTLVRETHNKCVYCESKIGHNTPGDVEHILPSSVREDLRFTWDNLTIACTECNRRKSDYLSTSKPFLNPYSDDVENRLRHSGPLVYWAEADVAAEATVRKLELNDLARFQLICRKAEKLNEYFVLRDRTLRETDQALRLVLVDALERMKSEDAEYSAMIRAIE